MIPHGVDIFIALEPVDLRWGFDRLAGTVWERFGRDARGGALFVFLGRRRTAVKLFFCDESGMCVFYKRLDRGQFRLPTVYDERTRTVCIDERMLEDLLRGVDLELPTRH